MGHSDSRGNVASASSSPRAPRDPACPLHPFAAHSPAADGDPVQGSGAPPCLCAGSGLYWGWQGGLLGDHLGTSRVSAELVRTTGGDEQRGGTHRLRPIAG